MVYIIIDLHARQFSISVMDEQRSTIFEQTLPTSCQNLKAAVRAFAGRASVVFEESALAAWAYRVLEPCADQVVVADPLHNHWIAGDEKSNDETAARKLAQLLREIARQSKAFGVIKAFQQVPGIALIRAATFFAIVDTPHRFAHKRKLWAYCGLGVVGRQSDQMVGPQHLTRAGNPRLKDLAKGAAISAIRTADNQYSQQYRRLLAKGIKPENARLTVARAILATLYAIWRAAAALQEQRWRQSVAQGRAMRRRALSMLVGLVLPSAVRGCWRTSLRPPCRTASRSRAGRRR